MNPWIIFHEFYFTDDVYDIMCRVYFRRPPKIHFIHGDKFVIISLPNCLILEISRLIPCDIFYDRFLDLPEEILHRYWEFVK